MTTLASEFAEAAAEAIPAVYKAVRAANNIYDYLNQAYHIHLKVGATPEILAEARRLVTEAARHVELASVVLSMAHTTLGVAASQAEVEASEERKKDHKDVQNAVKNARSLYHASKKESE
jgi:hypothetical protein